ncbi:AraC family transcriptional regulator [Inquilinus limosus]|uniref:AraC family transcriptional regulator n=1 Tax=Inquilinus limosus TaxID=171674 RepID=UPI003F16A897
MRKPTVTPEERKVQELVHRRARAQIEQISPENWRQIAVSRYRIREARIDLPPLPVPSVSISRSRGHRIERILRGRRAVGWTAHGHIALLPSDAGSVWTLDQDLEIAQIFLDRGLLLRTIEEEIDRDSRGFEIKPDFLIRDHRIERIAAELLGELEAPGIGTQLLVESLALDLAIRLAREYSNLRLGREPRSYGLTPRKLADARAYIEANLDRDITLNEMAEAVGMSRFHFAKSFKIAAGTSPYRFLIERRLEKASDLLLETDDPIASVAQAVGFNSQSRFTQAFARDMGVTPARYRARGRSRPPPIDAAEEPPPGHRGPIPNGRRP